MSLKICTECGETLPLTKEYFHRAKQGKYGFKSKCKECRNKLNREYKKDNWEQVYKQRLEYRGKNRDKYLWYNKVHCWVRRRIKPQKYCTICNEEKKLEIANISGNYIKSIDEFFLLCRSCHLLYDQLREARKGSR